MRLKPCLADSGRSSSDAWNALTRPLLPSSTQNNGNGNGNTQDIPPAMDDGTGWGSSWDEDWDPTIVPDSVIEERKGLPPRRREGDVVRDKWLSPLLDWSMVLDALDPDEQRTEDRIRKEAITNDLESRDAVRFGIILLLSAWLSGLTFSRILAEPILTFTLQHNPNAFELTDKQKVEGAHRVHVEEFRLRMEAEIGKIPPITEPEMFRHLREFALHIQEEEREHNEQSLLNVVSDSISGITFFSLLVRPSNGRRALFSTIGRVFAGLSDIAKAFIIILVADTLLGYHSAEGWTGFLNIVCEHYGLEPSEDGLSFFVAIVPVSMDVMFKYWIFNSLNKISPEAVVTIKAMNRH